MAAKMRRLVDGLRWVCAEGEKHCADCSAHRGREFYHDPEDGQEAVEGVPQPSAHPNCRWKRMAHELFVHEAARQALLLNRGILMNYFLLFGMQSQVNTLPAPNPRLPAGGDGHGQQAGGKV